MNSVEIYTVCFFGHRRILNQLPIDRKLEEACYAYYDEIEICEKSSGAHFKSAFQVRNKSMVDRSDLVICYIETNEGGAFQTLQYTIQQGKEYLNLYSTKEEMELEKP